MSEYESVVIDTESWIRSAISPGGLAYDVIQKARQEYQIVHSEETLKELETRLAREKFDKYLSPEERASFLQDVRDHSKGVLVTPEQEVEICRDPNDDKFLSLAVSSGARLIVSTDDDLLELQKCKERGQAGEEEQWLLNQIKDIEILRPEQFLSRERKIDQTREVFSRQQHEGYYEVRREELCSCLDRADSPIGNETQNTGPQSERRPGEKTPAERQAAMAERIRKQKEEDKLRDRRLNRRPR